MENFSNYISQLFFALDPNYRIIFIFLFSFLEGLPVVGSIFPGGSIALLIGTLSLNGYISNYLAIILITVGNFIGDIIGFFIGRKFKNTKLFNFIIKKEGESTSWKMFDKYIIPIILFTKIIPIIRSVPSVFAGARSVPWIKYFILSFCGSLLWATFGIYGGKLIALVFGDNAIGFIFILLIILILISIFFKKNKK